MKMLQEYHDKLKERELAAAAATKEARAWMEGMKTAIRKAISRTTAPIVNMIALEAFEALN